MRDCKQDVYDVKETSYITSIPIEEFENLADLEMFTKAMNKNEIGVVIKAEYSNFHQGVFVEAFDKRTISVTAAKELLK